MAIQKIVFSISLILTISLIFFVSYLVRQKRNPYLYDEDDRGDQKVICSKENIQRRGAFCIDRNDIFVGGSYILDGQVCKNIEELVGNTSIADFGSGMGQYGRCLLRTVPNPVTEFNKEYRLYYQWIDYEMTVANLSGKPPVVKSWEGFDGGIDIENVTSNFVKHIDLAKHFDLGKTYDWVMSLEVGEHIPEQYEDIFIENVIHHARKGVIISWAIPGQGGHNHVNEKPNEAIIEKFTKRGLIYNKESSLELRKDARYAYFQTNIMVFLKPS